MEEAVFISAIKRCSGYTELNWRGEPLLHPRIVDFVKLAKFHNKELNLGFHTNTYNLDESLFCSLVTAGIDWIHVSLHTAEACVNFRKIQAWNKAAGDRIYVYAEVDNSDEELVALSCGIKREEYQKYHIANWAGYLTGYKVIHEDPYEALCNCEYVKKNMVIVAWDGSVNACCWDFEQKHIIGHVDTFESIFHKPPYELCRFCIWSHEQIPAGTDAYSSYKDHMIVQKDGMFFGLFLGVVSQRVTTGSSLEELKKKIDMNIIYDLKMKYMNLAR